MSTIGQVRRMLRIQALEAAKREDYRTRTRDLAGAWKSKNDRRYC